MFRSYLLLIKDYRNNMLNYLGLFLEDMNVSFDNSPEIQLQSTKISLTGKGLVNKDFEYIDVFFSQFNCVKYPKILRNRNVKQCN